MEQARNVREGMHVHTTDDKHVGTVDRVTNDGVIVDGRRIELSQIARVSGDRVYIRGSYNEMSGSTRESTMRGTTGTVDTERDATRVPIYEERLDVEKRSGTIGEVTINKTVETEEVSVPVELRREQVDVQQRDVADRPVDADRMDNAFQEQTIRVPIKGEEAIIEKQAYVTGEVEINKTETVERQEVHDTVRRERVNIDDEYQRLRPDFQREYEKSQRGSKRTFEQAEAPYRYGVEAAYDERYSGKKFEDIEPELRKDYETRNRGGDGWEQLKAEVREAYNRVRR